MESSSIKVIGNEVEEPSSAPAVSKCRLKKQQCWCGDLSCRWKYDVEILPWETEENLKIAMEVELGVVFRHQDKREISVGAEFVWTRSQQAERCACVG